MNRCIIASGGEWNSPLKNICVQYIAKTNLKAVQRMCTTNYSKKDRRFLGGACAWGETLVSSLESSFAQQNQCIPTPKIHSPSFGATKERKERKMSCKKQRWKGRKRGNLHCSIVFFSKVSACLPRGRLWCSLGWRPLSAVFVSEKKVLYIYGITEVCLDLCL